MDKLKETIQHPNLHIGMRNVKTALTATLCALLYFPFGRNPTFACIGAVFGMGYDMNNSFMAATDFSAQPLVVLSLWHCSVFI